MILGVLGRALALFDVEVHAFVFLSDHLHLLLAPGHATEWVRFIAHVERTIFQEPGIRWAQQPHGVAAGPEGSPWATRAKLC